MSTPTNAAAPIDGVDQGERNVQQGHAEDTRVTLPRGPWRMADTPGLYAYDTAFGASPEERHWRQMAAGHRKRAMDVRTRASYALNDLMGVIFPAPNPRPSTYGMDDEARRKYAASLMAHQEIVWQAWEIQMRLTAPESKVAA